MTNEELRNYLQTRIIELNEQGPDLVASNPIRGIMMSGAVGAYTVVVGLLDGLTPEEVFSLPPAELYERVGIDVSAGQ